MSGRGHRRARAGPPRRAPEAHTRRGGSTPANGGDGVTDRAQMAARSQPGNSGARSVVLSCRRPSGAHGTHMRVSGCGRAGGCLSRRAITVASASHWGATGLYRSRPGDVEPGRTAVPRRPLWGCSLLLGTWGCRRSIPWAGRGEVSGPLQSAGSRRRRRFICAHRHRWVTQHKRRWGERGQQSSVITETRDIVVR